MGSMAGLTEVESRNVKKLLAPLESKQLFCDPDFPASDETLYLDEDTSSLNVIWKRPSEICKKPKMFVDGSSRFDVNQGSLGDCWFLAACTSVGARPDLLQKVIPEGQVLCGKGYSGLVTFRFWKMGEWVTINIDDRLPCIEMDTLLYGSSKDPNEFWLPLLEKAFAKFHGTYQQLDGGLLVEGFISLTGYICESAEPTAWERNDLFKLLRLELHNGSLITCSRGDEEKQGLLGNHAYTVTGTRKIRTEAEGLVRLVRVRNPWGSNEWTGSWSDGDARWSHLDAAIKKELEYDKCDDGEFWMKTAHFQKLFEEVTIATKIPDFNCEIVEEVNYLLVKQGTWKIGVNVGGRDDKKLFATNPQYLLTVVESDDGEVCEPGEASDDEDVCKVIDTCSVVVELIQEHNRKTFPDHNQICITVYKASKQQKRLTVSALREFEPLEGSSDAIEMSSVVSRLNLKPGNYVIIPSAEDLSINREYLLRVYCRKPVCIKALS